MYVCAYVRVYVCMYVVCMSSQFWKSELSLKSDLCTPTSKSDTEKRPFMFSLFCIIMRKESEILTQSIQIYFTDKIDLRDSSLFHNWATKAMMCYNFDYVFLNCLAGTVYYFHTSYFSQFFTDCVAVGVPELLPEVSRSHCHLLKIDQVYSRVDAPVDFHWMQCTKR